jgi:hypothetical protein
MGSLAQALYDRIDPRRTQAFPVLCCASIGREADSVDQLTYTGLFGSAQLLFGALLGQKTRHAVVGGTAAFRKRRVLSS